MSSIRQSFQLYIGPFTYLTDIAVHYLSYTVRQISLYGSIQSQQRSS